MNNKFGFHLMRNTLVILLMFSALVASAASNPIITATEGVQRVWLGQLITSIPELATAMEGETAAKREIQQNGFITIDIGEDSLTIFSYKNSFYLHMGHGSGFFVSEKHAVTNHHVIANSLNNSDVEAFVLVSLANKIDLRAVTVLWSDESKDLAVLEVEGINNHALSIADVGGIQQTLPVTSVGFPGTSDQISGGTWDENAYVNPKTKDGSLSGLTTHPSTGVKRWEHNAAISGGSSGGALVNNCGEVVGVNVAGHETNQQTLMAVAIQELLPELRKLNIPFKQSSGECVATGAAGNFWMIALLAIMLLIIIAYLAYAKKQQIAQGNGPTPSRLINSVLRRLNSGEGGDNDHDAEHKWQKDDHGRLYRHDPIRGIIYKKDELKPEQKKDGKFVTLIWQGRTSGELKLYPGKNITVGRGKNTDITLSNNYISSKHLSFSFDGKAVLITDLGSTNGSYINGQKISKKSVSQNIEIRLGDGVESEGIKLVFSSGSVGDEAPNRLIATLKPVSDMSLPEIILRENELVSIGTRKDNTVMLRNNHISAQHCFLRAHSNGTIILEDNGSTNGTYVVGVEDRIIKLEIYKGQKIYLATQEITFEVL